MQTHLQKYICSTGRKEASRSECYETLDVGCPASCVSHLLYLEHRRRGVAGAILSPALSSRPVRDFFAPRRPPARVSSSHVRRHPAVIRLEATATMIIRSRHSHRKYLTLLPGSIDVSISQQRCCRGSLAQASSIISNLLPRLALGRNFD